MIKPSTIPTTSGIYCIVNSLNGKRYVGSSTNIRSRIYNHLSMLRRQIHYTTHLQSAWNKYGNNAWTFEIIENCDPALLEQREEYFIQHFQSRDKSKGYNTAHPTRRMEGYKHSDETKAKLRKTLPRAWAASSATRSRPVKCNELNKIYPNAYVASIELNICRRNIDRVCKGERARVGSYTFQYVI